MMTISFVECNYLNMNKIGTKSVHNPNDKVIEETYFIVKATGLFCIPSDEGEKSMKIAFWSEQKGAGTTFNLAVVACASVCLHPLSVAVVPGGYCDDKLEQKLFGSSRDMSKITEITADYEQEAVLAAETQDFFMSSGLACLLRKERIEDLTETVVKANMRQVVKDRMYCLPANAGREYEWWYHDYRFVRMGRVLDAVESYFDVVFIDCGSRQDDYAKKVLSEADICVWNILQEADCIGKYYLDPPKCKGENFFLLGKYFSNALYNRENLQRIYRVEESRLGAIPYNAQLHAAEQMGRMDNFVEHTVGGGIKGKNTEFEKELVRTTNLILKMAGLVA